jgi:hypothetical protein
MNPIKKTVGILCVPIIWLANALRTYFELDAPAEDIMSFRVGPEARNRLSALKLTLGLQADEALLRRALALLEMSVEAEQNGKNIAIIKGNSIVEIVPVVNIQDGSHTSAPVLALA